MNMNAEQQIVIRALIDRCAALEGAIGAAATENADLKKQLEELECQPDALVTAVTLDVQTSQLSQLRGANAGLHNRLQVTVELLDDIRQWFSGRPSSNSHEATMPWLCVGDALYVERLQHGGYALGSVSSEPDVSGDDVA